MNGVLLIDKPSGITSHDVVSRLRRALKMRRIGHAGTLDPDATGLLVMCLGRGTKISAPLTAGDKCYEIGFQLGKETDTYDSSGKVVAEKPVTANRKVVAEKLADFVGVQEQRPPLYSAVKVRGRKLYEYARKGEPVDIPVREVTVYLAELLSYDTPHGTLRVQCSKGTYVRSLVHDLGQALGTGAITTTIRRVRVGNLSITDALPLSQVEEADSPVELAERALLSISTALGACPKLKVSGEVGARVLSGGGIRPRDLTVCEWESPPPGASDPILVIDEKGEAIGLGSFDGLQHVQVRRVF